MDASPPFSSGRLLRRLRKSRKLTLEQVEQRTGITAPVLSRMERDQREVTRADCTALAVGYGLGPWESYTLFAACGFLPSLPGASAAGYAASAGEEAGEEAATGAGAALAHAHELLRSLKYPAAALDGGGWLLAWNGPLEALQAPLRDLAEGARAHVLDDLFAPALRKRKGEEWRAYAAAALRHFAGRSLMLAADRTFLEAIERLHTRHGDDFAQLWREVTQQQPAAPPAAAPGPGEVGPVRGIGEVRGVVQVREVESPRGPVHCLATSVALDGGLSMHGAEGRPVEVQILLPLDAKSITRYQRLLRSLAPGTLHEAPAPLPPAPPPDPPPMPDAPMPIGPMPHEQPPPAWRPDTLPPGALPTSEMAIGQPFNTPPQTEPPPEPPAAEPPTPG